MATTILGIDPGARETGLVTIEGDRLTGHRVVKAAGKLDPRDPIEVAYLELVDRELTELAFGSDRFPELVAIERVTAPNPHLGMTNVAGALGCAAVIGAAWAWAEQRRLPVLLIDTAGHGSSLVAAYPEDLRGPRETKGTGVLRHARSAFDVALAARWYLKTGARA